MRKILVAASLFAALAVVILVAVKIKAPRQIDRGKHGVERVSVLPEVGEFKSAVEKGGRSTFHVAVAASPTAREPYYLIQVFETFPDHQTTFGWYRYDPDKEKLYRQDIPTDTWEEVP